MEVLTEIEKAYIAGILDGEGSIMLTTLHKNQTPSPVVAIASTDKELLDWLKEKIGGSICIKPPRKETHNVSWDWKIAHNLALEFLKDILPYMRIQRKIRRAELLLSEYKNLTPRNGKYSSEMLAAKLDLVDRFHKV